MNNRVDVTRNGITRMNKKYSKPPSLLRDYYTPEQVAEMKHLTADAVRHRCRAHIYSCVRIGRYIYLPRHAFDRTQECLCYDCAQKRHDNLVVELLAENRELKVGVAGLLELLLSRLQPILDNKIVRLITPARRTKAFVVNSIFSCLRAYGIGDTFTDKYSKES